MSSLRSIRARVREMDPVLADALLAGAAAIAVVLEGLLLDSKGLSRPLTVAFGLAGVVPALVLRRRRPLLAMALFVGVMILQGPFDTFLVADSTTPFVTVLILCYSAGRHLDGRSLWAAIGLVGPGMLVVFALEPAWEGADDLLWILFLFTPPILAGRALRSRALLQRELREKAEVAEAAAERRALEAAEEERARIASELQALVANGVSAMVVQAEAVPRLLAAGDSARSAEALGVVEETGRDALAEMRRLLGVLRRDGERPRLAPQPGLATLETLAEHAGEAGLEVRLDVHGERRALAPGVDLTAYRVLQEGVRAAAASGAAHATVSVRYGDRDLELAVADDRPASSDRAEVAPIRERVGLYGGHVRAGRPEGAGFVLEARLPMRASGRAAAGSPA